jgi:hypothetical protein
MGLVVGGIHRYKYFVIHVRYEFTISCILDES